LKGSAIDRCPSCEELLASGLGVASYVIRYINDKGIESNLFINLDYQKKKWAILKKRLLIWNKNSRNWN
jgi:hypothetical protein